MASELTFRDFAGALMGGDDGRAAEVLEALLAVDAATAKTATATFRARMTESPAFVQKAMGMRQVVETRDKDGLIALLGECFGLAPETARAAAAALLSRYAQPD